MLEMKAEMVMYVTNMLAELLPSGDRTKEALKTLGIELDNKYIVLQLLLGNELKNIIHSKSEEEAVVWKEKLNYELQQSFLPYSQEVPFIFNLQPLTRTLVLKVSKELPHEQFLNQLKEQFYQLSQKLNTIYGATVVGCFGPVVGNFFGLGTSYKKARKLQSYRYSIGMGKCAFFDIMSLREDSSLIEYKYLHLFEELIMKKEWYNLLELIIQIKEIILQNHINDSKANYIYKEIFSITIRYLFGEVEQNKDEIKVLNEAIIQFEDKFDDIQQIHDFYLEIFGVISAVNFHKNMNPHIKKTLQIIHYQYMEAISLDYIADKLGLSTAYLSRLFKSEMETNFKVYLTEFRLEKAKELLLTTKKDIAKIREQVGYFTPTQFVRAFKAYEGMTPSKYRQYNN